MSIKIITKGKLPEEEGEDDDGVQTLTCDVCGTVFECPDKRITNFYYLRYNGVECPYEPCKNAVCAERTKPKPSRTIKKPRHNMDYATSD